MSREEELQRTMMNHLKQYSIRLKPTATTVVSSSSASSKNNNNNNNLRTRNEFVQQRLMDAGVFLSSSSSRLSLEEVSNRLSDFIRGMEGTGCYEEVKVMLHPSNDDTSNDDSNNTSSREQELKVMLKEKAWYKVYVGGGLKGDPLTSGSDLGHTKVQLESTIGLRNLTGTCDMTEVSYAVDQTSTPSFHMTHHWPLLALGNTTTNNTITQYLQRWRGGQPWHAQLQASMDTLDHLHTRSCRERMSKLELKVASSPSPTNTDKDYQSLSWMAVVRDLMPRRHSIIPYQCDASPQLLHYAGPSLKHSLLYQHHIHRHLSFHDNHTNNKIRNDPDLLLGTMDAKWNVELAGPPGNTGFFKTWGGIDITIPTSSILQFHASCQAGFLQPLSFATLCNTTTTSTHNKKASSSHITDRFFVGGPNQLRGFMEAGIGPRAKTGGASVPGGDALGGNSYYTTTLAASIPATKGIRMFSFLNIGNLTSKKSNWITTTRLAVGAGIFCNLQGARMEATYAIPLRYSHKDATRRLQAGIGITLG